jgi:hypothetical protein
MTQINNPQQKYRLRVDIRYELELGLPNAFGSQVASGTRVRRLQCDEGKLANPSDAADWVASRVDRAVREFTRSEVYDSVYAQYADFHQLPERQVKGQRGIPGSRPLGIERVDLVGGELDSIDAGPGVADVKIEKAADDPDVGDGGEASP